MLVYKMPKLIGVPLAVQRSLQPLGAAHWTLGGIQSYLVTSPISLSFFSMSVVDIPRRGKPRYKDADPPQ